MRILFFVILGLLSASAGLADTRYVRINNPSPAAPYLDWSTAATNIQDAVDASLAGDTVVVSNGVYATSGRAVFNTMTNRVVVSNAITVVSVNGPQVTAIVGASETRGVYLGTDSVLSGFTITNGHTRTTGDIIKERSGGGIWCEPGATVLNCIVISNVTTTGLTYFGSGGGIYGGTISNCVVAGNVAGNGGGIAGGAVVWNSSFSNNLANVGGGAYGAVLRNCQLSSNNAVYFSGTNGWGAGAAFCVASNSLFSQNTGLTGGGIYRGTNFSCIISANKADSGGGTYASTNLNCRVTANTAGLNGGGAHQSVLYNCIVDKNVVTGTSAGNGGGGVYNSAIYNCTVVSNSAVTGGGGGVYGGHAANSIIYYNQAENRAPAGYLQFPNVCTYPALLDYPTVTNPPAFVDIAGENYRLKCGSVCIDYVPTNSTFWVVTNDVLGRPRPMDGDGDSLYRGDIGAYEFDPATDQSVNIRRLFTYAAIATNFPVSFYAQLGGCETVSWWDFGDGATITNQLSVRHEWTATGTYDVRLFAYYPALGQTVSATTQVQVVFSPVYYADLNSPSPTFPYTNWTTAAHTIQQAIGAGSVPGRLVLVTNGTYQAPFPGIVVYGTSPNCVAMTNAVRVKSVNGPDSTYIWPASSLSRAVFIGKDSVLDGFKVTGGRCSTSGDLIFDQSGGGIWCEPDGVATNCFIYGNQGRYYGGGTYGGTFYNCTFSNNSVLTSSSFARGGGTAFAVLYDCLLISNRTTASFPGTKGGGSYGGELYRCTLYGNRAENGDAAGSGGGAFLGALSNCVLTANFGSGYGGGTGSNTLWNCVISANQANYGAGAFGSVLYNCLVVSNLAYSTAGGAYYGRYYNCTIAANQAPTAGGVYGSGLAYNTIIYNNFAIGSSSNWSSGLFAFNSCSSPLLPTWTGPNNNTIADPLFVDLAGGDLRLRVGSPCVDTGTNLSSFLVTSDFIGTPRPLDGDGNGVAKFDMGAYELDLWATVGTNWLTGFGLNPNDALVFASDPDGDGMTTLQEWIAGTEPNNASSALRMVSAVPDVGGITVTWKSVAGKTYFVQRRDDTITGAPFVTVQTGISGQAGTTSYTDSTAATDGTYFYRVGVQP